MSKSSFTFLIGAIAWLIVAAIFLFSGVNCHVPMISAKFHILNSVCETLGKETSFVFALSLSIICFVMAIRGANET
jgi:hypothetical protein